MSDEFYDYIQTSPTTWLRHYGAFEAANYGWHFCFAGFAYSPGSKLRVYSWGLGATNDVYGLRSHAETAGDGFAHFAPSTEQFFGGVGQTQHPFNNITSVSYGVSAFCTDDGKAYVLTNSTEGGPGNPNGLGPVSQARLDAGNLSADRGGRRNTPRRRNIATQIVGKDGELASKVIRHVSSPDYQALCLLTADGEAFFCGSYEDLFTQIGAPTNASHELLWPTKVDFVTYDSPSGTVTLDDPLEFVAITFAVTPGRGVVFCALSDDGKLFAWRLLSRQSIATSGIPNRLFELTGFVTSATVANGGTNYTGASTRVIFSDPQHPNGVKAQGVAHISGGSVSRIEITEPGWGYTSAPTFTVVEDFAGATASGAEGTATIFDGSWKYLSQDAFSAIDNDGVAYFWWTNVPRDRDAPTNFILTMYPFAPPGQHGSGYKKVSGPMLLAENGDVDTFNRDPYATSSSAPRNYVLTRLTGGLTFTDIAFGYRETGACLTDDGDIYTFGDGGYAPQVGQGNPPAATSRAPFAKVLGSAKWLKVFPISFGFIACRDEEFDASGNRIDPIPPGIT